jgi:hypothetical protein
MCVVSGLIIAQALGLPFNKMMEWRWMMIIAAGLTAFMAAFSLFALSPDATSDSQELGENTALLKKGEKKKDMTMLQLLKSKDTTISTGRESCLRLRMMRGTIADKSSASHHRNPDRLSAIRYLTRLDHFLL